MAHGERRLLYLTSGLALQGRSAFRGRQLVAHFKDRGWSVLVRHWAADSREEWIQKNPGVADDVTDAEELRGFGPDAVFFEGGLYVAGGDDWKLPSTLLYEFVDGGGVAILADVDVNEARKTAYRGDLFFFGAVGDGDPETVAYIRDDTTDPGPDGSLSFRPGEMEPSEWLRPALAGVECLVVYAPVALRPRGDVAASSESTGRVLQADRFIEDYRRAVPFSTVSQHGMGYAAVVAATITPDLLVNDHPGNARWLVNLAGLLTEEAAFARQTRRPGQQLAGGEVDPRATAELVMAEESETLEKKETARFNALKGGRDEALEGEVVGAVGALWNTGGGVVLIGVVDRTNEVTGLAPDYGTLRNRDADGFKAWLAGLLHERLDGAIASSVNVRIEPQGDVEVARIDVPRGHYPGWVDGERFLVRMGTATRQLQGPELAQYLKDHWPARA
ncbi:MAG: RNA-binding domain-containing protein [Acidimicrobiia bacterium]